MIVIKNTDTIPVRAVTYGDIVRRGLAICKAFSTRQNDVDIFSGFVNDAYLKICSKRNWPFRKQDRSFVFSTSIDSGTVAVVKGEREITFSTLTLDKTYMGRSIKIDNRPEIYRIIGVNIADQKAFLCSNVVCETNATASFDLYRYEFSLPPDCDVLEQVYIDESYADLNSSGQLDPVTSVEFNRMLSSGYLNHGVPSNWCRDGQIVFQDIPKLDEMLLDYDFLGGGIDRKVDRLRLYPIEPDRERVVHIAYSVHVLPLTSEKQEPIIPIDHRDLLMRKASSDYLFFLDRDREAVRMLQEFNKGFADMCAEYHVSAPKNKMVYDASRHKKNHDLRGMQNKDLFYASRDRFR